MEAFKNYVKQEESIRAGLLPYYPTNGKIMIAFMIPSNPLFGGDKPQIAKGHVEPGMNTEQTAIKEAQEELGYIHKPHYNIKLLWHNKNNKISWYYVQVDDMILNPHDHETGKVVWLDINDAENSIREWQQVVIKVLKRRLGLKDENN